MDTYKHRYLGLKSRWTQYHDLQQKQKLFRRQILLVACVLCLFIGFMAGMILSSPQERIVVAVDVPEPRPETRPGPISL